MFRFLTNMKAKHRTNRFNLFQDPPEDDRWYHGKSPPLCYWWMFFL